MNAQSNSPRLPSGLSTRRLGNSNLSITSVGFGAWAVGGGDWQFSWGPQEDKQSIHAIERAIDLGINWIDTAAVYGLGHSEEIVARALKNVPIKPYVFTKCGLRWDGDKKIYRRLRRSSVREELEASLRRLELEAVDLYQIHWPEPEAEIEEGWEALAELKEEGKVRYIGVSNFSVEQMRRVQKIAPITSLQPPFSLVNPAASGELLPFCEAHNIGVIVYSPMASGLLSGGMSAERVKSLAADDWRRRAPAFQQPELDRNLRLAEKLAEIGNRHEVSAGVIAIAWTLHHGAVTGAIVGGRSAEQVEGTIAAATLRLTGEEFAEIEEFRRSNG